MRQDLVNSITSFKTGLFDFLGTLGSIISTIISIVKALWYGFTSLLTSVGGLITNIFDQGFFNSVGLAFDKISYYIGGPATIILATFLFVIMLRIGVAFVFKLLKLNIDYHVKKSSTEKWALEDFKRDSSFFNK